MIARREIAPGWALQVDDRTEQHWLAVCGTVVVLVLRDGTHDDPRHVHAASRIFTRALRLRAPKHQFLVVFPPSLGKPPSERVRRALIEAGPAAQAIDRSAAVILGQGFMPSIHRGAITGVLAFMRSAIDTKVVSTLREGVAHVVGSDPEAIAGLTRVCEEQLAEIEGPSTPRSVRP